MKPDHLPPKWPRLLLAALPALFSSGCGRLESIPYCCPEYTPQAWLDSQPWVTLPGGIILTQPTSTAIIYFLGLFTIGLGVYFLRIRGGRRSRWWWGVSLLLWGLGALLAGTSYQAFGYGIKCAGRDLCAWTSWWEVWYLLVTVASLNAMLVAVALSCAGPEWRKRLTVFAAASTFIYTAAALAGAFIPVKFLISFELLVLVTAPNVVAFIAMSAAHHFRARDGFGLRLLGAWLLLGLSMIAYFGYYVAGITAPLWTRGIWFSENDVLHVALIAFMVYLGLAVANRVEDRT